MWLLLHNNYNDVINGDYYGKFTCTLPGAVNMHADFETRLRNYRYFEETCQFLKMASAYWAVIQKNLHFQS